MSELDSIIEADDLEELKRQVAYTFLDAYGNSDGADILFDAIVTATEKRIIKLLEEHAKQKFADNFDSNIDTCHEDVCDLCANSNGLGVAIVLIKGENK